MYVIIVRSHMQFEVDLGDHVAAKRLLCMILELLPYCHLQHPQQLCHCDE